MANFVYTRKDLVVGSVAMAIVIVLLGVGFGVASGKAAGAKSSSEGNFKNLIPNQLVLPCGPRYPTSSFTILEP